MKKNQKSKRKKKKINENQEKNGQNNTSAEPKSLESNTGLGNGVDGKIGIEMATQEIGILRAEPSINQKPSPTEGIELASLSSGLDESVILEKKKTEITNSNKTGTEPSSNPTGIPRYSSQPKIGKSVDNQLENSGNNKKKISPAITQVNGKEGKESSAPTQLLEPILSTISLGNGKTGKENSNVGPGT
jgi:hypothetical protein